MCLTLSENWMGGWVEGYVEGRGGEEGVATWIGMYDEKKVSFLKKKKRKRK